MIPRGLDERVSLDKEARKQQVNAVTEDGVILTEEKNNGYQHPFELSVRCIPASPGQEPEEPQQLDGQARFGFAHRSRQR